MKQNMTGKKSHKKNAVAEFIQLKAGVYVFCNSFYFVMSKVVGKMWYCSEFEPET